MQPQKQFIFYLLMSALMLTAAPSPAANYQTITFKSGDDVLITADSYTPHNSSTTPMIVLFHQAGSSRGEYIEIAPRLNELGFNCIAVDLRSGEYSIGKDNETAILASNAGLATSYVDALPDVIAALQYAQKKFPDSPLIAWGSSYSAALVIKVAGDHPGLINGVIAFSPGEYFAHLGKSKTWIQDSAKKIAIPIFITSSKDEVDSWQTIYESIPSTSKSQFIPPTKGRHGSRALWTKYKGSNDYWQAVNVFFSSTGFIKK